MNYIFKVLGLESIYVVAYTRYSRIRKANPISKITCLILFYILFHFKLFYPQNHKKVIHQKYDKVECLGVSQKMCLAQIK